uniref:Hypothetical secreted protein 1804 n=1 Tax=Amblyomma variegatum TaxID=34610 RepID=F0J9Y9_AMBVA|nr:TPA_inf: hypothetical secreted protein 1804 [Amblyomma variegatum]
MTCFFRRWVGLLLAGLAASDDESTASGSSRPWRRFLPRRLLRCLLGGTTSASLPAGSAATVMSLSNVIDGSADSFADSDGALAMLAIIRRLRYFSPSGSQSVNRQVTKRTHCIPTSCFSGRANPAVVTRATCKGNTIEKGVSPWCDLKLPGRSQSP